MSKVTQTPSGEKPGKSVTPFYGYFTPFYGYFTAFYGRQKRSYWGIWNLRSWRLDLRAWGLDLRPCYGKLRSCSLNLRACPLKFTGVASEIWSWCPNNSPETYRKPEKTKKRKQILATKPILSSLNRLICLP